LRDLRAQLVDLRGGRGLLCDVFLFFVAYLHRRAVEGARQARRPRPGVSWQAGRWDTDPRHAYVANAGHETAYEVSVTACDRVIGRASSVPPYRADRLSSSSELPCYVNFCVDERLKRQISLGGDRATQSAQDKAVDPDELGLLSESAGGLSTASGSPKPSAPTDI
jgi:hypothetical protein